MPTFASATLHALIHAVCTAGGSRRAGGGAGRRPAGRGQPHRPRFPWRRPPAVLRAVARTRAPWCRTATPWPAQRAGCRAGGRGPARLRPGDRPRGDGARHGARAASRASPCSRSATASTSARIGHWAEQCAAAGFASIHFVNGVDHPPIQAPFGSAESRLSTNPFCAALPGADGALVVLDMATSKIAFGKARVAPNRGVPAPEGSLIDADGRPTRDPAVMFQEPQGALVAMGEHKGSGLAILCELLAGALTGGRTIQPEHPMQGGTVNNMLSVIIDPDGARRPRAALARGRRADRLDQGGAAARRASPRSWCRASPSSAAGASAWPRASRSTSAAGPTSWRRRGPRACRTPTSTPCSL